MHMLYAEELIIGDAGKKVQLELNKYAHVVEEQHLNSSALYYSRQADFFKNAVNNFSFDDDKIYWIRIPIQTSAQLKQRFYNLHFNYLKSVELHLFDENQTIIQEKSGLYLPAQDLKKGYERDNLNLELEASKSYILLLRVQLLKGVNPKLAFYLSDQITYSRDLLSYGRIISWIQGAIIMLLIYVILAYSFSFYKPYIWIFNFLFFLGLYSCALDPSFINLFFPWNPKLGWLIIPVLLRIGILCFYILLIDFLQLRQLSKRYYKGCCLMIILVIGATGGLFIYNYQHDIAQENFYIQSAWCILHTCFLTALFITLWHKIDYTQRFLAYSVVVFVVGLFILLHEEMDIQINFVTDMTLFMEGFTLLISALFLFAIRLKLQLIEKERLIIVQQHDMLKAQYQLIVEQTVAERTTVLKMENLALHSQQLEYLEENNHAKTLMDELNHRVKNNLQLLYSLSSLYAHDKKKPQAILRPIQDMQGRIKAMISVNQLLSKSNGQVLNLQELVADIVAYLEKLYDPQMNVFIDIKIAKNYWILAKFSLSFGLILTELITNSYKYAFADFKRGGQKCISITCMHDEDHISFEFKDNGIGSAQLNFSNSFGISLIGDLTRQIKGKLTLNHHNSFHYNFSFPLSLCELKY